MIFSSYRAGFAGALMALAPYASTVLATHSTTLSESTPASTRDGENMSAQSDPPTAQSDDPSTVLQAPFLAALRAVSEQRKSDRSTMIDFTNVFADFLRYRTALPYIQFFRSIGLQEIRTVANQKHFVYWELDYSKLRSMGFNSFIRADRLVISLVVDPSSSEVISSKVNLMNTNHL